MEKQNQLGFGRGMGLGRGIGLGRGVGRGSGIGNAIGPIMNGTGPHGRGLGPGGGQRTGAGLALREQLSKKSEYLNQIYNNAFDDELKEIQTSND